MPTIANWDNGKYLRDIGHFAHIKYISQSRFELRLSGFVLLSLDTI